MRTGIPNAALTQAIRKFNQMIKKGQRHQNYRSLPNVVRGFRRRRNWLMRQGRWPVKRMVGKSFIPKFDYPEVRLPGLKP